jgi:hypothetical protein
VNGAAVIGLPARNASRPPAEAMNQDSGRVFNRGAGIAA